MGLTFQRWENRHRKWPQGPQSNNRKERTHLALHLLSSSFDRVKSSLFCCFLLLIPACSLFFYSSLSIYLILSYLILSYLLLLLLIWPSWLTGRKEPITIYLPCSSCSDGFFSYVLLIIVCPAYKLYIDLPNSTMSYHFFIHSTCSRNKNCLKDWLQTGMIIML